jgi:hypothetical protein
MDINQLLSIAWKVIASVGGIGAIIVGLSSWVGKIIGENVYLRTQAKYDKEIEKLKGQSAVEIERLRAEVAESQESLKSALSALSAGYSLSHEKVREALALLWNKVVEVRQFSSPYLRLYAAAGDDRKMFKQLAKVSSRTIPAATFEECYDKLEVIEEGMINQRPFIGDSLW